MPLKEIVTQADLALFEIMRNPVLAVEFIQNFDRPPKEERFKFSWYQKQWLLDFSDYVAIRAGRASGKTVSLVSIILWLLCYNVFPGDYVVFHVPNKVHLDPVWSGLVRQLRSNTFLKEFIPPSSGINASDFKITLITQATLICRLAGQTGTGISVIGLHQPFCIFDEAGFYPYGTFIEAQPTLNTFTPGYRMVVAGTPSGLRERNVLYHCDQENSSYSKHHITALENPRFSESDRRKALEQYGGEDSEDYIHMVCFPENTNVFTYSGYKDIKDIKIGETVLTHKGNWKKVTNTYKREYVGNLLSIKTKGIYKPILCTPDHPIYGMNLKKVTWSGNKPYTLWRGNRNYIRKDKKSYRYLPKFIEAKNLGHLDRVAFPIVPQKEHLPKFIDFSEFSDKEENGFLYVKTRARNNTVRYTGKFPKQVDLDYDFLFFLGLFIAEGSTMETSNQCSLSLNKKEIHLANLCKRVLDRLGLHYWEFTNKLGNEYHISFCSYIFSRYANKYLGHGAQNKKVPEIFLSANKYDILPFIEGIFAGDGSCRVHSNQLSASITSVSKELINSIIYLLRQFNINPSYFYHDGKEIQILRNKQITKSLPTYSLGISQSEIAQIYLNKVDTFDTFDTGELAIKISENISSILFSGYVYNLEVEDDNSYVVENMAVHNCGKHGKPVFALFDRSVMEITQYPVYKLVVDGKDMLGNMAEYYNKIHMFPGIPDRKTQCLLGIDLGYTEPTAILIMYLDPHGRIKFHGRIQLNSVSYTIQEKIIDELDTKFEPFVIGIDFGGVGRPVVNNLKERPEYAHKNYEKRMIEIDFSSNIILGIDTNGEEIKEKTKPFAVSVLQDYSNNHKIVYSTTDTELVTELERMTYTKTPSGEIVYRTLTTLGGKKGADHFTSALLCSTLAYYLNSEFILNRQKRKKLFGFSWLG